MKRAVLIVMAGGIMSLAGTVHADDAAAFLGVSTRPADSTVQSQLNLAPGTGLVVSRVIPGTSAKNKINRNDVLVKFNDQILVNEQQLRVLVQTKKPGDKVSIEFFRKGEETSVDVELGERPANFPVESGINLPEGIQIGGPMIRAFTLGDRADMTAEVDMNALAEMVTAGLKGANSNGAQVSMEDVGKMIKGLNLDLGKIMGDAKTGGDAVCGVSAAVLATSMVDDKTGATLTMSGKTLTITDKDGKKVFKGPVSTDKEKDKVPEKYRKVLDEMMKIQVTPWGKCGSIQMIHGKDKGGVNHSRIGIGVGQ